MKIFLDAGHGGNDPGATGFNRIEKNDVLDLTLKVGHHISKSGVTVGLTRSSDIFIPVDNRPLAANSYNADYFVSIHRNAGGGTGAETWIHSNNVAPDRKLAQSIQKELAVFYKNRGIKVGYPGQPTGNFAINRLSNMPSCLVEVGFMDTESDNIIFGEKIEEIAIGLARGICNAAGVPFYLDGNSAPSPTPTPPTNGGENTLYQVGQHVSFSSCYKSSTDPVSKHLIPSAGYDNGVITKIYHGTNNPYLINNGLCFVNNGDIRGLYSSSQPPTAPTKKTVTVKPGQWNIRADATTNAKIVQVVRGGSVLEYNGIKNGWYSIPNTGFISGSAVL